MARNPKLQKSRLVSLNMPGRSIQCVTLDKPTAVEQCLPVTELNPEGTRSHNSIAFLDRNAQDACHGLYVNTEIR